MRLPALVALGALALVCRPLQAQAADVDVVVGAGHEGRPASCARYHVVHCNLGASGHNGERESAWTPIVANAIAQTLRAAGLRVARHSADGDERDTARAAVFVHFDGSETPCTSGASVGFPAAQPRAFADAWQRAYRAYATPIPFVGENITEAESHYYAYKRVRTPGKTMLVEVGELSCPAQAAWMQPRLRAIGRFIARFIEMQLH